MHHLIRPLFAGILALLPALPAAAHEFWIDPLDFTLDAGQPLEARLRVGQDFEGSSLSYLTRNFTRFEVAQGDRVVEVEGRLGQNPALRMEGLGDGLAIVLYETTDNSLTWDDWDRFLSFAEHKDFTGIEARHLARGLPTTGFTESYSRHVKSLIAMGDAAGADRAFGLRTEFVALANPYTDDLDGQIPVRLLLDGSPRTDVQVELWDRDPAGEVTVTIHRTDAAGEVSLPVQPGHVYMADAVTMLEHDPQFDGDAVWHSLWASLTFEIPTP